MNKGVKRKWLFWLRSERYTQAREILCKENKKGEHAFCCHGVLSNIHAEETGGYWLGARENHGVTTLAYKKHFSMPSLIVTNWAGLNKRQVDRLAIMNDGGSTFKTIANYIERNL